MLLMDKIKGDPSKMQQWLLYRKLDIFHNMSANTERVAFFLKMGAYFYLCAPFVVLTLWLILIFWDAAQTNSGYIAPWGITIVCLFFMLFVISFAYLVW